MEKKLRVTWMSGAWSPDPEQNEPVASADIPAKARVFPVGEDVLEFRVAVDGGRENGVHLVVPTSRLVSAVLVEVAG